MYDCRARFRNPMDPDSIRTRLQFTNKVYDLAVQAAGHQSAYTVDKLSWRLMQVLPALIAGLAAEVEQENLEKVERSHRGHAV